jgi:RNA polymerase sigma-70 factor (ECF subfamily)
MSQSTTLRPDPAPPARPPPTFAELYRRFLPRTLRWLRRCGVARRELADTAQDAWLDVHRSLHQWDPARPFAPWLWAVVHNTACDHRRARRRAERLGEGGHLPEAAAWPRIEDVMDAETLLMRVSQSLPRELSDVLWMVEVEQFAQTEVAEILGVPVSTVYSRLHRARQEAAAVLKRLQAAERSHLRGTLVPAALWMDWRSLAAEGREPPPVPADLADRIWEGVLRGIEDEKRDGAPREDAPRTPGPGGSSAVRPAGEAGAGAPPGGARPALRLLLAVFVAGALAGGALVYWLMRGPEPAGSPPGASAPAGARSGRAEAALSAATALPGPAGSEGLAPGSSMTGASRDGASAALDSPAAATSGGPAAAPSSSPAAAPSSGPDPAGQPMSTASGVQAAPPARQPPVVAPDGDPRAALAALDAGRVLLREGRCAEAEARVRPHADSLSRGPYAAVYLAFSQKLAACPR